MTWKVDKSAALFCSPGAMAEKDGVRFTAAVLPGQEASVLLYDKTSGELLQEAEFPAEAAVGELRTLKVMDLPWNKIRYCYKLEHEFVTDPRAQFLADRAAGEDTPRSPQVLCGMDFEPYDWMDDRAPAIPFEDAVMYHLHVRNFTRHPRSKVRHKGTFLGLAEKIPYLKELGVNQVKLMPVYEPMPAREQEPAKKERPGTPRGRAAGEMPGTAMELPPHRTDYWGYVEGSYFAPRRFYASADNPAREMKDMVRAMHQNGIEVLLDMFFTENTALRTILDCLTYWVREFHIDGFHIMGKAEAGRYLAKDPYLADTKILVSDASSWNWNGWKRARRFAECNDGFLMDMRRILKGDEGMLEAFAYRVRRSAKTYGVINYLTNHDGFTLLDLVSYDNKHNEDNGERNNDGAVCNFSWNCGLEGPTRKKAVMSLRKRQMRNAFLLLLLSQGTPMLLAGDEFGNSQAGNNNPYCLDNEISWVDWGACAKNAALTEFVKKAIAFRREHRILSMAEDLQMSDYKSCGSPDLSYHSSRAWYGGFEYNSRQLGMMYCEQYAQQEGFLYVAYNLHPLEQELALPALPAQMSWYLAADTSTEAGFLPSEQKLKECRTIRVPARTIMILVGKKG